MVDQVGTVAQQGIISTQVERIQNDKPTAAEAPKPQQAEAPPPPPPPPADSGRGASVDTTA